MSSRGTVSERMRGRRTGLVVPTTVPLDTSGFEDVEGFWNADETTTSSSSSSTTTAVSQTPLRTAGLPDTSSVIGSGGSKRTPVKKPPRPNTTTTTTTSNEPYSPALSSPGFNLESGESSLASTPNKNKRLKPSSTREGGTSSNRRRSSIGGNLSDVDTIGEYGDEEEDSFISNESSLRGSGKGPRLSNVSGYTDERRDDNFLDEGEYYREEEEEEEEEEVQVEKVYKGPSTYMLKKEAKKEKAEAKKRELERRKAERRKERGPDGESSEEEAPQGKATLEFLPVVSPVVDKDEIEVDEMFEGRVRRSSRKQIKPLKFWKNERVVYQPKAPGDNTDEEDGLNTSIDEATAKVLKKTLAHNSTEIVGVLSSLPSPTKKKNRRGAGRKPGQGSKNGNNLPAFDKESLDNDYNYLTGSHAVVWDEKEGEYRSSKIVSFQSTMTSTPLPITATRNPGSEIVGLAAQAFNIGQATDDVPGWISGHVRLPTKGIKDAEGVGMCSQVFFVADCQAGSFEVAIGAPEEAAFTNESAQRFLLSAGDFFYVPPNNIYRMENHSDLIECKLFWTIIRPMATE